ncbi:MAG: hypothetical protein M1326_10515, partial [Cyanobacteria bacterium]|nr:hypothetical protein [Cyanobacteriota bacterium]
FFIFPHMIMLVILLNSHFLERHFIQWLLPFFIIFSLIIDKLLNLFSIKNRTVKNYLIIYLIFILFIFPLFISINKLIKIPSEIKTVQREKVYLSFVDNVLPKDGIILAGLKKENLIWISNYSKRSVIYNINLDYSFLIPYGKNYFHIPFVWKIGKYGFSDVKSSDFNIKSVLNNTDEFNKYKIFVLDNDVKRWNEILNNKKSGHPFFPVSKYYLKNFAMTKDGRAIYKLTLNEKK